jgi:hypothetical protein
VSGGPESYRLRRKWDQVLELAQEWAEEVKAPDLWNDLLHGQNRFTNAQYEDLGNTLFTPDEQADISAQLQEIKEYVRATYSLSSEHMSRVEARLDEAEEASRRIGRKDWILLFSGVLFTLIVTDLVPPHVVQHMLAMAVQGLEHLFAGSGQPPSRRSIS